MAARTGKDTNLFTPSGPYASSKPPSARGTRIDISGPAPPNETPAEKVARLRAAAQKAKLANGSQFDKVVSVGRVWADRAHRFTTFSLIGFTAVAGVVTALALGNMILYNRRKRNEWYAARREERAQNLAAAYSAFDAGTVTEEQMTLINEDKAEKDAKAAKKGVWKRAKESLFGGYSLEEKAGGQLGIVGAEIPVNAAAAGLAREESPGEELGVVKAVEEMVGEHRSSNGHVGVSKSTEGGLLDELADNAAKDAAKSWWGWATGR